MLGRLRPASRVYGALARRGPCETSPLSHTSVPLAAWATLTPVRTVHHGSDHPRPSPQPSSGHVSSRGISRIEFAAPRSLSHEGLAYAACPLCGASYHMSDMLLHLTTAHKQLDAAHCRRMCQARLNLYRKVIGVPLEKLEPRRTESPLTPSSAPASSFSPGTPSTSGGTSTAAAALSHRMVEALAHLPTVTAQGAYECQWCEQRTHRFPTRDAFLKHMIQHHPDLPLDDLEPHIPLPPPRAPSTTTTPPTAESDNAQNTGGWHTPASAHGTPLMFARVDGGGSRGPTRRLRTAGPSSAGVAAESSSTEPLPVRQVGITLPRNLDRAAAATSAPANKGTAAATVATMDPSAIYFAVAHFPCELCGKVLETELNLLQHLEGRHPTGEEEGAATPASASEAAASADIAQFQRDEASGAPPGQIYALCDLCGASKVYTLPSALYAHLRFKHPTEDAAFHLERILEASRDGKPLVCPHCARAFASQAALDGHVADKHGGLANAAATGNDGGSNKTSTMAAGQASGLPAVTAKTRWWCNECEKGFGMAKALHGHMVGKHKMAASQAFPCPACKRIFTDVYSLEEHFTAQHKSMNLKDLGVETHVSCPTCERLFLSHDDLHRHTLRHHSRQGKKASQQQGQQSLAAKPSGVAPPSPSAVPAAPTEKTFEAPSTPRKVARKRSSLPAASAS